MPKLLDQFVPSKGKRLAPSTVEGYLALQIARALHEEGDAGAFLGVSSRFPVSSLLHAYRTTTSRQGAPSTWPTFKDALTSRAVPALPNLGHVLALRVSRRAVGMAEFEGLRLESGRVRELANDPEGALGSAAGFVGGALARVPKAAVILERVTGPTRVTDLASESCSSCARREILSSRWVRLPSGRHTRSQRAGIGARCGRSR
jgi:hypothetical protein